MLQAICEAMNEAENMHIKEELRKKPVCPYCGCVGATKVKDSDRYHHCRACNKQFSVTVNTIFHDTKLSIQKWFLVMSLMMNAKKGLSAYQIARDLGMRRPTVWSMTHRIRKAMTTNQANLLQGIVEMNECYIGGKKKKAIRKKMTMTTF